MPAFAKISSTNSDAYTYLAESIEAWPDQHELAQWVLQAGFEQVAYRNLTGGIVAMHRGLKPIKRRKTAE
jgi:demethylmenaquinone methyltransferase/2-methoxy-6-polyprenyl-1,4-benzoquinol methylase